MSACETHGYSLVVTADHGNAEEMYDENGKPKTSHTTNLIPLLIAPYGSKSRTWKIRSDVQHTISTPSVPAGGLADVAPTVLALMGMSVPSEMTGKSLVEA